MPDHAEIEERTQDLGQALFARLHRYTPSVVERLQDGLIGLLMEDEALRNRILRFVDTLAALPREASGRRTAGLLREYLRGDLGHLPRPLRAALAVARSRAIPSPLVALAARQGTRLIAGRFIVAAGADGVSGALGRLEEGGDTPASTCSARRS